MPLSVYEGLWAGIAMPLVRRLDAQTTHHRLIEGLRHADGFDLAIMGARQLQRATHPAQPTRVGGVSLPHPIILAAGFVKGDGFDGETAALEAVARGRNIIPGWRIMPALVGAVEFGSFTRQPRLGNPGQVLWRDDATCSTQNRVGLRNPGARAAAAFLAARRAHLPPVWGVNLAPTPGTTDPDYETTDVLESAAFFMAAFGDSARGRPSWVTLNLSCPNTEDDPGAHQTEAKARRLCTALACAIDLPIWVKVGPGLAAEQYTALVRACAEGGARAIIATNTLGQPTPDGGAIAGVGGGRLRSTALDAVRAIDGARDVGSAPIDLIACGGLLTGADYRAACAAGASAAMIYSALVFRGALASALILHESG